MLLASLTDWLYICVYMAKAKTTKKVVKKKSVKKKKAVPKRKSGRTFITSKRGVSPFVSTDNRGKGRPTSYSAQTLELAHLYLRKLPRDEAFHSIAGLADFLDITRETIYQWIEDEDKQDFSDIVKKIMMKQEKSLANNGAKGYFNSSITKLMMGKHGYHDKQEVGGLGGGAIEVSVEEKKRIDELINDL